MKSDFWNKEFERDLAYKKCLNFGAGKDIKQGWVNVDLEDWDADKFPYPIESNTFDYILASHILEHLKDWKESFNELCRICKDKGLIEVRVPFYNCTNAFFPTHINFFTPASFDTWTQPCYQQDKKIAKFRIKVLQKNYKRLGLFIHNYCQEIRYLIQVNKE